jgi:hypothetical protein
MERWKMGGEERRQEHHHHLRKLGTFALVVILLFRYSGKVYV